LHDTTGIRILAVGEARGNTLAILERAEGLGWASYPVLGIVEAEVVLKTFRFDVVLAEEVLPDGRGYDLTDAVAQAGTSLFVAVALSEGSLWLPVVELGERSLGKRALNQAALEAEIEIILSFEDRRTARPNCRSEMPPRRKSASSPIATAATEAAETYRAAHSH